MFCGEAAVILKVDAWQSLAARHRARAEAYTQPARRRRDHGEKHPVEDFLWDYYPYPFASLEHWHPGVGVALEWPWGELRAPYSERHYARVDGCLIAAPEQMTDKQRGRLAWIRDLLVATRGRAGFYGCHGMHEWAMVYRGNVVRHESILSLRLPQAEIDALVAERPIRCSHFDAFRFFDPAARPLNQLQPSLHTRGEMEQPACLHANMDLYKWAAKAMPWVGSDLLLETFALAMRLRELDMRASPYDVAPWALPPVCIETPEGRREYEAMQRALADEAARLRDRLIDALDMWRR